MKNQTKILISLIIIATLGIIAYHNSLAGQFIWDDNILIVHNNFVQKISNIPALFIKNITYSTADISNFYRPLQMLTYVLNYAAGKLNTWPYHMTSIIFHLAAALALFWLVRLISGRIFTSLASALLFVSFPINTEAVSYISGIADPMAAFFILLTVSFYVKHSQIKTAPVFYTAAIASFILALLTKEIGLVTPLVLIAYDIIYRDEEKKSLLKKNLPFLLIASAYILLRIMLLNFSGAPSSINEPLYQRLPYIFQALSVYIEKIIIPHDLHMEYGVVLPPLIPMRVLFGAAIALFLVYLAAAYRKKEKIVPFAITWFFITYLPSSNLFPLNAFISEHWIYIPLAGFAMLVGRFFDIFRSKGGISRTLIYGILAAALLANTYLIVKQNGYWHDGQKFYKRTLRYAPLSPRLHFQLSLSYVQDGMLDKGIEEMERSIALKYDNVDAINNLKKMFIMKGTYDNADTHNNIGILYGNAGRYVEAEAEFKKAIECSPTYGHAYNNLAIVYFREKQYGLAAEYIDKAVIYGTADKQILEDLKSYRERSAQ